MMSKLKFGLLVIVALLSGFIGMGAWSSIGSLYYDMKFLHEARRNNDEQKIKNEAKQELIKQIEAQQKQTGS